MQGLLKYCGLLIAVILRMFLDEADENSVCWIVGWHSSLAFLLFVLIAIGIGFVSGFCVPSSLLKNRRVV
jgi:hypothetical protein